ncbi:MAG TPA: alanine dehydrogenase [Candidatus Bathyarchaeota archaeon]|nr:alanine dehydrogenase [Candidatus Bathyarchaeota archaeon]
MKTLLLTDEDVRRLLSMKEVIEAVELAFKEKALGRVQMPPKPYIFYRRYNGDLRVMPSYLEKLDISAVKVVNVHPDNPSKHKLPTVMATIILVDPKNGAPIAIMGGTWITAMRTGAAGGVAAKYLARPDSRVVGIIGAGVQARTQLMALKEVLKEIEEVRVTDIVKAARERYAEEMSEKLGLNVKAVDSAKKAVEGADIVVTVTPSREPIVKSEWIGPGVHINAIGADAPGKEELDPELLKRAKIIVDDVEQASHSGEINVPLARGIITEEDIWAELGDVVAGLKPGRTSPSDITIFDSTGLAIQDAVTAALAYKKALAKGIGQLIEIV